MNFKTLLVSTLLKVIIGRRILRNIAFQYFDNWLYKNLVIDNPLGRPINVQKDKYIALKAMLLSALRNFNKGYISPKVANRMINTLVKGALLKGGIEAEKRFEKKYGYGPPSFVTISPTKQCNLRCEGCYASSTATSKQTLEFSLVEKILNQMHEEWGSRFIVISGGEPMIYRSEGKTIMDLYRNHPDTFFLMYTNGTLIDKEKAQEMAKLGNITPAISVEGFEKETDERRKKGVFKKVLKAFKNLREAGVPFGISVTASRENVDILLTDEFYDFYFEKEGASYMWIFHYMPIGRDFSPSLMPTPEQRIKLLRKWKEIMEKKHYFVADFWNSGTLADGCIAFARPGGYFYIDWNGNIMPCVFIPYYKDNVRDLFREGKTITDAIMTDFFKKGRERLFREGFLQPAEKVQNLFMPCSIRDHYEEFCKIAMETNAKPEDEMAKAAWESKKYYRDMVKFDKELKKLTQPIWEKEYKT